MLRKLKLLAVIPYTKNHTTTYHAYLFNKKTQYVLPIKVTQETVKFMISPNTYATHRTMQEILKAAKMQITSIELATCSKTILHIQDKTNSYNISGTFSTALGLIYKQDIPIFIKEDVLIKKGLKVSKEMLTKVLIG